MSRDKYQFFGGVSIFTMLHVQEFHRFFREMETSSQILEMGSNPIEKIKWKESEKDPRLECHC